MRPNADIDRDALPILTPPDAWDHTEYLTDPRTNAAPEVSVIVCSYNGARKLEECLSAIALQTFDNFELLVVDDGSHDRTGDIAARCGARVIRHESNRGLAAARNTGIMCAQADIVAFTDDDCVPPSNWLEALVSTFQQAGSSELWAVGGAVYPLDTDSLARRYIAQHNPLEPLELEWSVSAKPLHRLKLHLKEHLQKSRRTDARAVYSLVGANMAFRRNSLLSVGMFDARIGFGGDEEDVCRRLRELYGDHCLRFDPNLVVAHNFEASVTDMLRRKWAYGRGNARSYYKSGFRIPPVPPFAVLTTLFVTFGLSGGCRRLPALGIPLLLYGVRPAVDSSPPSDVLAFAGLAFLEEVVTFAGFVDGWLRYRRDYRVSA